MLISTAATATAAAAVVVVIGNHITSFNCHDLCLKGGGVRSEEGL